MIERLGPVHLDEAVTLVGRVVAGMRSQGIDQWDEVYPDRERLAADLASGQTWGALVDGRLVGYLVLNDDQSPEYAAVTWVEAGPPLVIHRLCIDPEASGRGLGRALLAFAEAEAVRQGSGSIRLDAFSGNPRALSLYENNGYALRGTVRFRKGLFHCYEKAVSPVAAILAAHHLKGHQIQTLIGSFGKLLFVVDDRYVIRTSAAAMDVERAKIERAGGLIGVPRVLHTGRSDGIYYLVVDHMPGVELHAQAGRLDGPAQVQLGREVSAFLDGLHLRRAEAYDIGLYLPTLPNFAGTWRQGHQQYFEGLAASLDALPLGTGARRAVTAAVDYFDHHGSCLDYQAGPRLLHNDFHLKNLLVEGRRLSGVIDWECSQFGEADFDLVHLVHWDLFPPHGAVGAGDFTRTVLAEQKAVLAVPRLDERLAIYEIEQDFCQLIWSGGRDQDVRAARLEAWVAGRAADLLV